MASPERPRLPGPEDLRDLSPEDVAPYCARVRALLQDGLTAADGRAPAGIDPELAAIEITVALHRVFDFRRDRLVADASHAVLAHKVITGRGPRLATLGQADGLSPTMHRQESPYDAYTATRPGTAVSVGAGMALADRLRGFEDRRIVALLGAEGAGTGQTLEALDRVGGSDTDLLVILVDDRADPTRTTGAIRRYINRLRTLPVYREGKREMLDALALVPLVGGSLSRWAGSVKEAVANYLSPGHLFRELGWTYFGPEDGHDVAAVERLLQDLRRVRGPVLLHVVTGATGAAAPAADTGWRIPACLARSLPLETALRARMEHDPRIVEVRAHHEAPPLARGLAERTLDAGPCPAHAVALAGGLADMGMKPVVRIPAALLGRAVDAWREEAVRQDLPVVLALEGVGLGDGGRPHVADDLATLSAVPGATVLTPSGHEDVEAALRHALTLPGPSVLRLPDGDLPAWRDGASPWRPGRPRRRRAGAHWMIVALGRVAHAAAEAADRLVTAGMEVGYVDLGGTAPVDGGALCRALGDASVLVVEEHVRIGGLVGTLRTALEDAEGPGRRIERLGVPARALSPGGGTTWRQRFRLDVQGIVDTVHALHATPGVPGVVDRA